MSITLRRGAPSRPPQHRKRKVLALGAGLLVASYAWAAPGSGIIPGVRDHELTIQLDPPVPLDGGSELVAQADPVLSGPAPGLPEGMTYEALAQMQSGGTAPDGSPIDPAALVAPTVQPGVFRIDPGASAPRLPFYSRAAIDNLRAAICLTTAIYYEAASESDDGQRGVGQVVLNRARHPAYPKTVCGVVFQGTDRGDRLCQFSFACDGAMLRAPSRSGWARARRIAAELLSGQSFAPVGMATHYHTHAVNPIWNRSLTKAAIIGNHVFFRWPGSAGTPASFTQRYTGGEPFPAPKIPPALQMARTQPGVPPSGTLPPVPTPGQIAQQALGQASYAPPAPPRTPVANIQPEYRRSGDAIDPRFTAQGSAQGTDTSQINPEYRRSGEWIGK